MKRTPKVDKDLAATKGANSSSAKKSPATTTGKSKSADRKDSKKSHGEEDKHNFHSV